jgi:adenylate cyclase
MAEPGMPVPGEVAAGVKRRLAAVFSADVEGFSRLCGDDEAGTLQLLEKHIDELFRPIVRAHKGRITNRAGDEIFAEFKSAVAAVKAALEIQDGMADRNANVDPRRQMRFRIGLNLCEVVVAEGGIFGDGVNVAARAQAQAAPGAICATDAVVTQVRGKVDAKSRRRRRSRDRSHRLRCSPSSI